MVPSSYQSGMIRELIKHLLSLHLPIAMTSEPKSASLCIAQVSEGSCTRTQVTVRYCQQLRDAIATPRHLGAPAPGSGQFWAGTAQEPPAPGCNHCRTPASCAGHSRARCSDLRFKAPVELRSDITLSSGYFL